MRIDNSNKRYSNIIAGILVAVLASIFVAFALGMGGFKTDLSHYISPSSGELPYDAENEVSKINILGNNADVSIAKEWEIDATPTGLTILLVPSTVSYISGGNTYYFTDMPGYFPLMDVVDPDIPNILTLNDLNTYYFTLAVYGNYEPDFAELEFEQNNEEVEIDFTIREYPNLGGMTITGLDIMGITDLAGWQFYHFGGLQHGQIEFLDGPAFWDPIPTEIEPEPLPDPPLVEVEIEIDWISQVDPAHDPFSSILSQK